MSEQLWNNENGNYIGYYKSFEGSGVAFTDILEEAKSPWCIGMAIFENNNALTKSQLKEIFKEIPEQGVVLKYLEDKYKEVFREGITRMNTL